MTAIKDGQERVAGAFALMTEIGINCATGDPRIREPDARGADHGPVLRTQSSGALGRRRRPRSNWPVPCR